MTMSVLNSDKNSAEKTFFASAEKSSPEELKRQKSVVDVVPYLKELFAAFPHTTLLINAQRQIVLANEYLLNAIGVKSADVILGLRPGELFGCVNVAHAPSGCGTADACRYCGAVQAVLASMKSKKSVTQEARITVSRDGKEESLDVLVTSSPIEISGFEPFAIVTISDISGEKRRKALERIFFHDVINTASSVRGFLQCLQDSRDVVEARELADDALRVTEYLILEIEEYRDLAAAEHSELKVNFTNESSLSLLRDVATKFSANLAARGLRIEIDSASENVGFRGSKVLLSRILTNLMKNACEASSKGCLVKLSCSLDGAGVLFSVHNEAQMPDEVAKQVFQRSFSTKGPGRGLGTYGSKLLLERYLSGKIWFASDEKSGTTFYVWVPLRVEGAG